MASAAAVAADQALSPDLKALDFEQTENGGTVTSSILPPDEKVPDNLHELHEDDDDDEDIVVRSRPRGPQMNGAPDGEEEEELGDDDDLFGDGDDADDEPPQQRTLDDQDLDSGDDEGRGDRIQDEEDAREAEEEQVEQAIMEAALGRQPVPEPSDGEMYLTKVPRFLSIDPKAWHHTTYQPPTTDHHSREAGTNFSAYNTALSTVHWRKSPSNQKEIQSNARILRWSDGTLSLQFASNPTQQFVIEGNPLAPRQAKPIRPTPTSQKGKTQKEHGHDTFTYLALADPHNQLLRITHKITAGLSILPSAESTDEALEKLQNSLAKLARGKNNNAAGIEIVEITEDPDLARQKAEIAEREKQRAAKRRENAEARERERGNRTLGRSSGRGYAGGLSASMLEDDEEGAGKRPKGNRQKPSRRQRRNSEYSEDEDFGRKRGNFANDEYDEADDFIAGSDEEEEAIVESDSDDGIVNEPSSRRKSAGKRPSPQAVADDDDDEDAEGEDEEVVQSSRVKRRRVVADDDDDE